VRVRIASSSALEDAVSIELGGDTYVAPLGPARVPGVGWELASGEGAWIELVARSPAFFADVALADRITLLVGDVVASERGGPEVLRVVGE